MTGNDGKLSPCIQQLRETIRAKIEDGDYPPGTAIPSENELAAVYGLSRQTVRNAVEILVREGLLRRVAGKGVYVRLKASLSLEDREFGFRLREPLRQRRHVLRKTLRPAGPYYGEKLGLEEHEALFYVQQRVLEGAQPLYVEEFYLPRGAFPGIETIEFMAFDIVEIFRHYGKVSCRTEQSLEIVPADARNGKRLELSEGDPILLLERRDFDGRGYLMAFFRYRIRGDVCDLRISFSDLAAPKA